MEAIECIKTRRSIRKFEDKKVPHDVIEDIVNTAVYAPSWKNTQVVRYIAVEDPEILSAIAGECVLDFKGNASIISGCKTLIVETVKHGISGFEKNGEATTSKEDRWETFDAGIAAQTFCLAAHAKGLGTVVMGIFDDAKVAEKIALPEGQIVTALIAIGYPDIDPKGPARKTADDVLSWR